MTPRSPLSAKNADEGDLAHREQIGKQKTNNFQTHNSDEASKLPQLRIAGPSNRQELEMAGYRTHITVSGLLGVAYGGASMFLCSFSLVQAAIAASLTWVAGMLPDLDSETGRPVQELSGLTASLAPLLLMQHIHAIGVHGDRAMLFALIAYGAVRYGGRYLLAKLTVHRGMFHSLPAMFIASEITFLTYHTDDFRVRVLMAVGVGIGFLSHLILDELYSVQWDGAKVRLAKSSGTALKFFGTEPLPNGITMGLLLFLSYATMVSAGVVRDPGKVPAPEMLEMTMELKDAPPFRVADQPQDKYFR